MPPVASRVAGWPGIPLQPVLHGLAHQETGPRADAWAVDAACGWARHDTMKHSAEPARMDIYTPI
jgi:hypothetical protein